MNSVINFWEPVLLSLKISLVSLGIVFVLGTAAAKMMANRRFRGFAVVETIMILPLVLPPTVIGFLLIIFFGRSGTGGILIEKLFNHPIVFTWWAAVIASAVVAFPLMYQSARTGFESIDDDIENAARVDGAGEWRVFTKITLPLAVKSLIAGVTLSFARGLGEFGATLMFAGNIPGETQTVPTAIYIAMESGNEELAWSWVLMIVLISFALLLLLRMYNKE
ncbi:molybdate transport system permease protein [Peribacillus deserti]|uniref:Molybdenum transport system permease n=1 Tax=Peribacillus deserti TaxID=673318 RepID=A0ABS2QNR7_9BACI|nr:molybdate ABC transporter permease subunit [Peribacillus deserti]MBM7694133.1 molybdate transport system permease protein [Peribacillus deserti]